MENKKAKSTTTNARGGSAIENIQPLLFLPLMDL